MASLQENFRYEGDTSQAPIEAVRLTFSIRPIGSIPFCEMEGPCPNAFSPGHTSFKCVAR